MLLQNHIRLDSHPFSRYNRKDGQKNVLPNDSSRERLSMHLSSKTKACLFLLLILVLVLTGCGKSSGKAVETNTPEPAGEITADGLVR